MQIFFWLSCEYTWRFVVWLWQHLDLRMHYAGCCVSTRSFLVLCDNSHVRSSLVCC